MYDITIPQGINQIISIFHRCGMLQEDETVSRKIWWKLIYLILHATFVISFAIGGFLSDDKNESIFLVSAAVQVSIITVKLIYILWKNEEILAFLHEICVHSVTDHNEFSQMNTKLKKLMKFASGFIFLVFLDYLFAVICLPLFSKEKILPVNIAFPFDWKNSEFFYWMAYAFIATGIAITTIIVMLNILIWYIMMNCSIKYQILGNQFRNMGLISETKPTQKQRKITEMQKQKSFTNELIGLIKVHQNIQEYRKVDRFKSCFSYLFFAQITTSGICICGSVYVLAFSPNENVIQNAIFGELMGYSIFDIFMVMYLGNEIKLSSDRLSYCLFESSWINQSKSCKQCIIILSEVLRQPHQLTIGKLYLLDLKTFLSILNLAYSMFNILRNFN